MSNISTLIEQITSKEYVEADKLFEQLMAEKVSAGLAAKTAIINENMMAANPDLFQSPVDQAAAIDHAPVEAEHSARTDEIEVPEPVEVDGSYEGHPGKEAQEIMNEDAYEQFSESHDFEADEDEQHQHPENVAAEPVGASAEHNQATQAMSPSDASPAQVEESLDHSGVGSVCEDCGAEVMAEEEHVCEVADKDIDEAHDEEDLQEKKGDGRNMNRLGTTLGGMSIGGTLGALGGVAAGTAGALASGVTNPDAAENIVRGAGAAGNIAGTVVGGVKGWKHATKQNKAMYSEEDTEMEEELTDKQKKIDLNKNGKIDGSDLSKLRGE